MRYKPLIFLYMITLSLTSLKIKIAGMSIEYIKNESDQKNIVQNNSKKCYTSFKTKHDIVFQNCIRYYKSNFKNVKFEEFLEMFMTAKSKSKIILDTYTKERFELWSKEIVDWKPIMDIFMFLGVKFQNNFLFNAVYYMNKFEERPIRGNEFINYFKFNYIESVKKGITYLINECYKDTRETLYDLQKNKNSLNFSIFEKYLDGFEDDNKKIFEPREVDYLRKFRLPSSFRDKNTRTNMDYNIHLYLFESIFASSKSGNTLTLFPELLLYRIKFKESLTLRSIRDVHHLITFIIFKVESILLFLFKEEINLKKVMYIPKYVAIIIESVVLTGRCTILKNLKCQKSDFGELKNNYKYFEFLAYISFLKIGGVDLIAQNYSPKFSITLDFYSANEADLAALIN